MYSIKKEMIFMRLLKSCRRDIDLTIGMQCVSIPSVSPNFSRASLSEEIATISKLLLKYANCPLKKFNDKGIVVTI